MGFSGIEKDQISATGGAPAILFSNLFFIISMLQFSYHSSHSTPWKLKRNPLKIAIIYLQIFN